MMQLMDHLILKKQREKKMIVDVRSPVSAYLELNGFTIYVEVSEATENKPQIDYWKKGEKDDGS